MRALIILLLLTTTADAGEIERLQRQLEDQRAVAELTMNLLIDEINSCRSLLAAEQNGPVRITATNKKEKK